ncbi:hypothetical protein QF037_009463 [Streptomyces canus]|nr:hypothetical protein [Streptomyces canus]
MIVAPDGVLTVERQAYGGPSQFLVPDPDRGEGRRQASGVGASSKPMSDT